MVGPTELYAARLSVPAEAAPILADVLAGLEPAPASVSIVPADDAPSLIEALFEAAPDPTALRKSLAPVAAELGLAAPECTVEPLPDRDWVAETLRGLGPVRAGRFRVLGTHLDPATAGGIPLVLDAGPAFGSGHHETTRGCLLALDGLRHGRVNGPVLDLGCGSGVLAMAAAHLIPGPVLAADIDPAAVRTARANLRLNGLSGRIQVWRSDGFANPVLLDAAPFGLIVANILAEPLKHLAPEMRRHIALGGLLILSGLLRRQERGLRALYRAHGFVLLRRIALGQWPTLILRRD
jgi:ribosomal protein L11 methyltransferase